MLTTVNLRLLHAFARHGVIADDVWKSGGRKVLFAGLLLGAVIPGVLFHCLEPVVFPTKFIVRLLEEFARLFADL